MQSLDAAFDVVGKVEIVVIQEGDVVAGGGTDAGIPGGGAVAVFGMLQIDDLRIGGHHRFRPGTGFRAGGIVIHDDQFDVAVSLMADAFDGPRQIDFIVVGGDDDAYQWFNIHGRTPILRQICPMTASGVYLAASARHLGRMASTSSGWEMAWRIWAVSSSGFSQL